MHIAYVIAYFNCTWGVSVFRMKMQRCVLIVMVSQKISCCPQRLSSAAVIWPAPVFVPTRKWNKLIETARTISNQCVQPQTTNGWKPKVEVLWDDVPFQKQVSILRLPCWFSSFFWGGRWGGRKSVSLSYPHVPSNFLKIHDGCQSLRIWDLHFLRNKHVFKTCSNLVVHMCTVEAVNSIQFRLWTLMGPGVF